MTKRVQPAEPDGITTIVIYSEDLLHDSLPQPDDMPYSEAYTEEDELWAQLENISLSDDELAAIDTLSLGRRKELPEDEDEVYWSQVDDIGALLDGELL